MSRRRFSVLMAPLVLSMVTMGCAAAAETPGTTATATEEPTPSATSSPSASPSSSPTESEEAEAIEERVTIGISDFGPATLAISAGTEVVFENQASFDHTVTEGTGGQAVDDPIVDAQVAASSEVRVTFDEPGTYDITCEIHPTMQMTITVED
jgi:plastocyanin